ncbi:mannose-1-phosphate guanyltransferase Mpg1 [Paraphysoderma sedebokerense]|nr:mannose-1-phosphate guanyltransferase Mpg1 [Paraphysoderma sedebokerense]
MKALILVGGFGTRLRPLTLTVPKPLVEFANKSMILHQIEALVEVGVKDIVLAVNYKPEVMVDFLKRYEDIHNVKITFSVENEPLGTAGPLALARDVLAKDDDPFFVLNSDVICEFPFRHLLDFHNSHNSEGTIMVTKVEDPSKYGVVCLKQDSTAIDRFVEKPQTFVSNKINAGIYIFNPSILDRIEPRPTSIEKEIFPVMASEGHLHALDLPGFWMDVGQPKDYLTGISLYLSSVHKRVPRALSSGPHVVGNVLIDPSVKIGHGCKIGPNVTIAEGVIIGDGVRLKNCAIFKNCIIRDHCWIEKSIIGWNSRIGRWTRLEGVTVLGDDVTIADEIYVNGGTVLPHKSISACIKEPRIVM